MSLDTIDAIIYIFIFLLPGYIVNYIVDLVGQNEVKDSNSQLLKYLSFSSFEYGLWGWLVVIVAKSIDLSKWSSFLMVALLIFVTSLISGIIIAFSIRSDFIGIIAKKINIPLKRHIGTSWDYVFSREKGKYIIVHLKDNTKVFGSFFVGSYASSDSQFRDIYIKGVFYDEGGKWVESKSVDSIWISPSSISYIEFVKEEREDADK